MVLTGHPFRKAYAKSPINDIDVDDDQIRVVERRFGSRTRNAHFREGRHGILK
jgi:hypothetical protein